MGFNFEDFAEGFFSTAGTNLKERKKADREILAREQERRQRNQDEFTLYKKKTDFKLDKQVIIDTAEEARRTAREDKVATERKQRLDDILLSFDKRKETAPRSAEISIDDLFNQQRQFIAEFGKDSNEARLVENRIKQIIRSQQKEEVIPTGVGGQEISKLLSDRNQKIQKASIKSPLFELKNEPVSLTRKNLAHERSIANVGELANIFTNLTAKVSPTTGERLPQSRFGAGRLVNIAEAIETKLNTISDPDASIAQQKEAEAVIESQLKSIGLSNENLGDPEFSSIITDDRSRALRATKSINAGTTSGSRELDARSLNINTSPEGQAIIRRARAGLISREEAKNQLRQLGF